MYKTPRNAPKCVKYWDKVYKNKAYFFDWQLMKSVVESRLAEIMKAVEVPKSEARVLAWNAYCAAVEGDEDSPLWDAYQCFSEEVADKDVPEFVMYQTIGGDLNGGWTEKKSRKAFIEWLKEDLEHGDYGDFRMKADLTVVPNI